jgi:MFS family permease
MRIKRLPPQLARRLWLLFLLVSPLAYLVGVTLLFRQDPNVRLGLHFDRAGAVARAREFAAARGLDASGWQAFCRPAAHNDRHFYYRLKPEAAADARRFAPEVTVNVLLVSPDRRQHLEVELAPDGRPLGYTHRALPTDADAEAADDAVAARAVADEALRRRQQAATAPPAAPTLSPTVNEDRIGNSTRRTYSYAWPAAALPEMERRLVVTVRGRRLEGERVEAKIDADYARRNLQSSLAALIAFGVGYGLIVAAALVFGIYRFVQRAQQKEISYARGLLLAVAAAGIFISFILLTDVATYDVAGRLGLGVPTWVGIVFASISYLLGGLLLGLAYASGEGDIREAYPGRLTSLDALLVGRVLSQNAARAVVVGTAFGGWALMLSQLALLPWAARADAGTRLNDPNLLLGRSPAVLSVFGGLTFSLLPLIVGILLPLPLLLKRVKSPRVRLPLLFACAWFACLIAGLESRPWAASLLIGAAYAAVMLAAFFAADLLTAFIALAAPSLVSIACYLVAQPAPALQRSGVVVAAGCAVALVAALIFAVRGRRLHEDEVRPRYAVHLAERLSLKAEANAAREAQVRLMPPSLPAVPGLALAAACRPAHEVGGDFYDFFEIEPGKVGVLVAEGGGRGLASALDIAFAKGFLMPKIRSAAHGDNSPVEIVRALQSRLAEVTPGGDAMSFAYAVIDTADATLRYARCGRYPLIAVGGRRAGGDKTESEKAADGKAAAGEASALTRLPEEREIRFRAGRDADETFAVTEGACFLEAGEAVVFVTDGLAKSWEREDKFAADAVWRELSRHAVGAGGDLEEVLGKVMGESARRAERLGVEDDLTAVVVKVEQAAPSSPLAPAAEAPEHGPRPSLNPTA